MKNNGKISELNRKLNIFLTNIYFLHYLLLFAYKILFLGLLCNKSDFQPHYSSHPRSIWNKKIYPHTLFFSQLWCIQWLLKRSKELFYYYNVPDSKSNKGQWLCIGSLTKNKIFAIAAVFMGKLQLYLQYFFWLYSTLKNGFS